MNDDATYFVIINEEDQYSIWPSVVNIPAGWRFVAGPKSEDDCSAFVDSKWTDMRPKSLRISMSS